jgi:5-formyltetrahydrofolate cyclo-ligase
MVQQSKKDLRREMKMMLANLDSRWIAKAHSEVCDRVAELVASLPMFHTGPRSVLAWIPCFPGEVDLAGMIGLMLKDSLVYLPRVEDSGRMQFVRIQDDWGARLSPGPRGIMQPGEECGEAFAALPANDIFVIIPGLAFDQHGRRLGRGGGYYDRFLAQQGLENAIKIGVCWSMQVVQAVPTDLHDVRMDWVCYERGVVKTESEVD